MVKNIDILMVVSLEEEYDRLIELCPRTPDKPIKVNGDFIYRVTLPNERLECYVLLIGEMNNNKSLAAVKNILTAYRPKLIVLLGIAGRIDTDLRAGDVVIAENIHAFLDSSKAKQEGNRFVLEYSGSHWTVKFPLIHPIRLFKANYPDHYLHWQEQARLYQEEQGVKKEIETYIRVNPVSRVGPLASGPTVATSEAYLVELRGIDRKFLALEMEAAGVAEAAGRDEDPIDFLVIRGLSDTGEPNKKEMDKIGDGFFRRYAMQNAVSFFLHILETGDILPFARPEVHYESVQFCIHYHSSDKTWIETELAIQMEKCGMSFSFHQNTELKQIQNLTDNNSAHLLVISNSYHSEKIREFLKGLGTGEQLIDLRRRAFIILTISNESPFPIFELYRCWGTSPESLVDGLQQIYSRFKTIMPTPTTQDLFIQTIVEELEMGKQEYQNCGRLLDTQENNNIFAAMYLSAQIESFRTIYERLKTLESKMSRDSFQSIPFIRKTNALMRDIEQEVVEVEKLIELGIRVVPEHVLGMNCRIYINFIYESIRNIKPKVRPDIGNSRMLVALTNDMANLSAASEDLLKGLYEIQKRIAQLR